MCSLHSKRQIRFWKKWSFLINFGYSAKNFGCLWKNPRQLCHNRIYLSIGTLWVEVCFWGFFWNSLSFSNSEPFFSVFHWTSLHKDVTTELQVSRKMFWGNLDFLNEFFFLFITLDIDWKVFGLLAENAPEGSQDWLLHV